MKQAAFHTTQICPQQNVKKRNKKKYLYFYYGFSLCIGIIFFIISRWRLQTEGTGSMGLEPRAVCLKGRSLAYMSPHATHWVQSLP
jgi:hypothetical protein